ncbi:Polysaccharide lyase [Phytophthora megakarya]|uniref:Probable pectate lyase F n=1 Tax=Phytophthora megakarya TaxID=4795 RepID=A0A225WDW8_9STRA|nr:Polysaccharide lyase [Phytophthora megakarya]
MVKSFVPFATSVALLAAAATAASLPDGSWPASKGTVQFAEAHIIKAGEVFDGKMQTFERSDISCEGQTESGASTAVFKMEPGSTLKNVIIGKNQMEGVHCDKHDCTIENVWWDDVCEDAFSVKGGTADSVTKVIGGGARYADDKVIQHNGFGTVEIDGFYGEDISKLYRSCGTCGNRPKKVNVSNVYVVNPTNAIVTVNKNWGDEATLKNIWIKSGKATVKVCQWSQGNANGEPKILGNGPSPPLCQYSESDVHINQDISQASSTSSSASDPTQQSSASTSSDPTQQDPTQTASSTASSASASSSETPIQSSSTTGSSLASSASSNSSADASDAMAPGTVSPVDNGNNEESVVSTGGSQTEQQDSPTNTPSVSSSSSGSSTDDVSQTDIQQSSVASSNANDRPMNDVQLRCDSSSGSNAEQVEFPTHVASSNANDRPMDDVQLRCDSSSGSNAEQIEFPIQSSTAASASTSSGSNNEAQNQVETFAPSVSTASSGSVTQNDSPIQNSGSDSVTQNSGSGSATNSTGKLPDGTWPASTGVVLYSEPYIIKAGEVFDGKMQTFERSDITCQGQTESGASTAVFKMEPGSTLKNAIIGKNQMEGVHCDKNDCTIENVWWDDVCEDAFSVKGGTADSVTTVTNCGARYADDKVIQFNGMGTVKINGFFAQEFGKLYRSCGTCAGNSRTVEVENVYAIDPKVSIVTVNKNYGDKATLRNIHVKTTTGKDTIKVCQWSQGGKKPINLGDGPSGTLCNYSASDIHINEE